MLMLQAATRMEVLDKQLTYQTGDEKVETEKQILQLQSEKDGAAARKKSLEKERAELEEKIRLQEKRKETL